MDKYISISKVMNRSHKREQLHHKHHIKSREDDRLNVHVCAHAHAHTQHTSYTHNTHTHTTHIHKH